MKTINIPCKTGEAGEKKIEKKQEKNYSHKNDKNTLVTEKSNVFYEYHPAGGIYNKKKTESVQILHCRMIKKAIFVAVTN